MLDSLVFLSFFIRAVQRHYVLPQLLGLPCARNPPFTSQQHTVATCMLANTHV